MIIIVDYTSFTERVYFVRSSIKRLRVHRRMSESSLFLYMVQTPGNPCQCKVLDPSLIKKDSWNLVLLDLKRGMFCSFVQRGPPASVSKNYCFTLCKVLSDKYFSGCSPVNSFLTLLDHLWIRESGWASITLFIKKNFWVWRVFFFSEFFFLLCVSSFIFALLVTMLG